jgi:hypothetical protein
MKKLLTLAFVTAVSAAALAPATASAQTRVHVVVSDYAPSHYDAHDRYAYQRQYRPGYVYTQSAWSARDGRYVQPRRWIDRNRDGIDDRRGRRDLDRDGVRDRYDRDLDNDGIANRYDRDIDGDGVRNDRDRRPDNRYAY